MAQDFDVFPVYDPLIKMGTDKISDIWGSFMATFYQNLVGYLSQYGIFVPKVTATERDSIRDPQEGQMIYNTTIIAPQIFQNGGWKTFMTV